MSEPVETSDVRRNTCMRRWWPALLCAAWAMSWPLLMLESSRGLPGIMFFRGDRGLYDLLDVFFQGPSWRWHLSVFLVAVLGFRALFGISAWLDRDGRAVAALRWAFAARSLRWMLLAMVLFVLAALVLPSLMRVMSSGIGMSLALIAYIAAYFFVWNPKTLQREHLIEWWRPYWPGLIAAVLVLVLSLVANAGLKLLAAWWGEGRSVWAQGLWGVGTLMVDIALTLTIYAIWFGYRRRSALRAAWSRLFRLDMLRAYLGFLVLEMIGFLLIAIPVMVSSIVAIYFEPQYLSWGETHTIHFSSLFQHMAAAGRGFVVNHLWVFFGLPLGLFFAFVEARLVFRDGLGAELGPQARRR